MMKEPLVLIILIPVIYCLTMLSIRIYEAHKYDKEIEKFIKGELDKI